MKRVALVTGAARGIGRCCAIELAKAGFDLAIVDLDQAGLDDAGAEIRSLYGTTSIHQADVADFKRTGEVVADTLRTHGRIDFLLNNAGLSDAKGILEITEAEFDRTVAINLKSCFNYAHHVAPGMLAQESGRIVSMSSLNALSGGVTAAISKFSYAAAKAGILGMTRSLAKELGPHIAVNAICPGVIRTQTEAVIGQTRAEDVVQGIALKRIGAPIDIANVVVFLATNEPNFITGQTFVIDGFQYNL